MSVLCGLSADKYKLWHPQISICPLNNTIVFQHSQKERLIEYWNLRPSPSGRKLSREKLAKILWERQPYLRYSRKEMLEWSDAIISKENDLWEDKK